LSPVGNEFYTHRFLAVVRRSSRFCEEENRNSEEDYTQHGEGCDATGGIDNGVAEQKDGRETQQELFG